MSLEVNNLKSQSSATGCEIKLIYFNCNDDTELAIYYAKSLGLRDLMFPVNVFGTRCRFLCHRCNRTYSFPVYQVSAYFEIAIRLGLGHVLFGSFPGKSTLNKPRKRSIILQAIKRINNWILRLVWIQTSTWPQLKNSPRKKYNWQEKNIDLM